MAVRVPPGLTLNTFIRPATSVSSAKTWLNTLQSELGCGVGAPVGTPFASDAGRGVDDASLLAGVQQGEQRVVQQKNCVYVDLHHLLPLIVRVVGQRCSRPQTRGMVHDAV